MQTLLWLDDIRDPTQDNWLIFSPIGKDVYVEWVTNYQEFVDWIMINGLPDGICFDHDLGPTEETGYDCAKWLTEYCYAQNLKLPFYNIQSSNPVGKENIKCYLENYKKHIEAINKL